MDQNVGALCGMCTDGSGCTPELEAKHTVFALDYRRRKTDTGIRYEDVERIEVLVLSGDEIIRVFKKGAVEGEVFDGTSDERCIDYYDGHYVVEPEDFEKWHKRKASYDYL